MHLKHYGQCLSMRLENFLPGEQAFTAAFKRENETIALRFTEGHSYVLYVEAIVFLCQISQHQVSYMGIVHFRWSYCRFKTNSKLKFPSCVVNQFRSQCSIFLPFNANSCLSFSNPVTCTFFSSYCLLVGSTSASASATATSGALLPLLKNPRMLFLLPSGLVPGPVLMLDHTLDRRLVPSAFVLTG